NANETSNYRVEEVENEIEEFNLSKLTLEEIGIYQLCPRRFYYTKKYKEKNIYTTSFQLSVYIANELYWRAAESIFDHVSNIRLVEEYETGKAQSAVIEQIPKHLEGVGSSVFSLFPVSEEVKESAYYYSTIFLGSLIRNIFDR